MKGDSDLESPLTNWVIQGSQYCKTVNEMYNHMENGESFNISCKSKFVF
jgi:hypothetical protein